MKEIFRTFLLRIVMITIILEALGVLLYWLLPRGIISPAVPFLVLFFFITTAALYKLLLKSAGKQFSHFMRQFMLLTIAKLLIYLAVIAIYVFLNKPDAFPFVFAFFFLYLIYTVFEVSSFMNDQKKIGK